MDQKSPEFASSQAAIALAMLRDRTCEKCGKTFRVNPGGFSSHRRHCGIDWTVNFWAKVDKNHPGGCWVWTASRKPKGYGQFLLKDKMHRAHRLAWSLSGRELPAKGLELAHRCDNRLCVNPEHLFVATHTENMQDCLVKGRFSTASLTPDQVREIRRLLAEGKLMQKEIGALMGVKGAVISQINLGHSYRWVK